MKKTTKYFLIKNRNDEYAIVQLIIGEPAFWFSPPPKPARAYLDISPLSGMRDIRNWGTDAWWRGSQKYDCIWNNSKEETLNMWEKYKQLYKTITGKSEYEVLEELNFDD